MSEGELSENTANSIKKCCLRCQKDANDENYFDLFDDVAIELDLSVLLFQLFEIYVEYDENKSQLLCETCLNDLINEFDLSEHKKQIANSNRHEENSLILKNESNEIFNNISASKTFNAQSVDKPTTSKKSYEELKVTKNINGKKLLLTEIKSDILSDTSDEDVDISENITEIVAVNEKELLKSSNKTKTLNKELSRKYELRRNIKNTEEITFMIKDVTSDNVTSSPSTSSNDDTNSVGILRIANNDEQSIDNETENSEHNLDSSNNKRSDELSLQNNEHKNEISDEVETLEGCLDEDCDQIKVVEEIELYTLHPISNEPDQTDIASYLDDAINTDFTTLKFAWIVTCNDCHIEFEYFEKLLAHTIKKHILTHNEYNCPIENCAQKLEGKKYLARHLVLAHAPLAKLQIYGKCPGCSMTFSNFLVFNKHSCARMFKRRRGMRLYCESCDVDFTSLKRYVFHMQFHLETYRPKVCFICNYTTCDILKLFEHVNYHHQGENAYFCTTCDRVYRDKRTLMEHKHFSKGDFICEHCNKGFSSKIRLAVHTKSSHMALFNCDFCKAPFTTESSYRHHLKIHVETAAYFYVCSNCGIVNHEEEVMKDHISLEESVCFNSAIEKELLSQAYTCEYCSVDFRSKCDLKVHRSTGVHNDGIYICLPCNKTFTSMKIYRNHNKHKLPNWWKSEKPNICYFYMCNIGDCDECYNQWNSLYTHKRRTHESTKPNEYTDNDDTEIQKPTFVCQFCHKICKTKMSLSVHIARRHNNKNMVCEYCNANFKDEFALKKHVDFMHIQMQCPVCLKLVKNRRNYEVHQRVVHLAEKRYFCETCRKGFYHKSDKEAHEKLHTKRYQCTECEFVTNYEKSLQIHVNVVHRLKFEFECQFCHKNFGRKQSLNVHLKRHTSKNSNTDGGGDTEEPPFKRSRRSNKRKTTLFETDELSVDGISFIEENVDSD